jgi:hypothetical protein
METLLRQRSVYQQFECRGLNPHRFRPPCRRHRHIEWNAESPPLAASADAPAVSVEEMQPSHAP